MRPIADLAQFGYRVVAYDQFGCGLSQRARSYRGMTIDALADEAEAVRRELNLCPCHLLGPSFGGALALQTALRHPRGFRSPIVGSGYASVEQLSDEKIRLASPQRRGPDARTSNGEDRLGPGASRTRCASEGARQP
ncbi:MAG: alpha/beta fold hydrolase [Thermoplasmata archaeon]